ncbi:MAG TPA: undecaprenyl/decaprenyl-phosphate alpha-N-acetylglucosaminyl 1-phosphate transferase, partial [Chitinophagaceae bacterium]
GDSGSLVLGLINAILAIKFITVADNPMVSYPIQSAVSVGFAILMLPLTDTLRVFSIRIFRGRSPFSPDRNHIHHLLLDRGLNHKYVTLACLVLNMMFISLAYFTRSMGPTYVMMTIMVVSFLGLGMLIYLKKPVEPAFDAAFQLNKQPSIPVMPKVVSINKETAVAEN